MESKKHVDFYQWLNKKSNKELFPISRESLEGHYRNYKKEHGAISNVIGFFCDLPKETQIKLRSRVIIDENPIQSTEELIKLIYQVRSKFAHSTTHTLEIGNLNHFSTYKGKMMIWRKFTMNHLLDVVEEGIVCYFSKFTVKT